MKLTLDEIARRLDRGESLTLESQKALVRYARQLELKRNEGRAKPAADWLRDLVGDEVR